MQHFRKALPSAKIDDGVLFCLPRGILMLGDSELPQSVFLRPRVHEPLFDLILALQTNRGKRGFVLTGIPGTGKTVFLYYVLWRLATWDVGDAPPPCVVFERELP